jgi:hypothetical protein
LGARTQMDYYFFKKISNLYDVEDKMIR